MHRSRSQRAQTIRLVIVYTAMTLVVLVTLTILLLFIQGYRYDASRQSIEQGGLVQFESKPSGATIIFDNQPLSRKTSTRLGTSSGTHSVVIERDGYRPWQKTITVDPGAVHWLDYVRLIPKDLKPESVYSYDKVDQSLAAFEQNKLAVVPDKTEPLVEVIDTSGNQPQRQTIEVPDRLISEEDKQSNPKLTLISWDKAANRILSKVKSGPKTEWVVIDTRSPAQSVNLSSLFESENSLSKVVFDERSSKHVYALSDNVIFRAEYEEGTKPQPVVMKVEKFSQSARGVLAYTNLYDKDSDSQSVGYYTPGASRSKTIKTYYNESKASLNIAIGEYFSSQYMAIQHEDAIQISRLSLHPSDSDRELSPSIIGTLNLEDGVDYLSFSPSERFVVAQHKATYATYDLELSKVNTTTLRGESPVTGQLSWIDDFHLWGNRDNKLRLYEFDGANTALLDDIAAGQTPLLTNNGRYLYYIALPDGDKKQSLQRIQLIR